MDKVKVKCDELLKKVKDNLENHIQDYKDAIEGYKQESILSLKERKKNVAKELDKLISRLENEAVPLSLPINLAFTLKIPQSYEKDYRRVISMLEMSVDEEIILSNREFACYVMDDWDWKDSFQESVTLYKR